jgi:hypothetical protein
MHQQNDCGWKPQSRILKHLLSLARLMDATVIARSFDQEETGRIESLCRPAQLPSYIKLQHSTGLVHQL